MNMPSQPDSEPLAPPTEVDHRTSLMDNSSRESKWILVIWFLGFLWVVGYSSLAGDIESGVELRIILGMPAWVFWGVFFPWIVTTIVTIWFALFRMRDDDLSATQTVHRALDPGRCSESLTENQKDSSDG